MTLAPARPSEALAADLDRTRRTRGLVEQLIADPALLGPDFTPIRRLDATAPGLAPVLGWKATGRGAPGTPVADTLTLLEHAAALGLVERLDWAFRAHTFDVAVESGISGELHLTPEAGDTFHGIFIRAPWVEEAGPEVEVIARCDGHIVGVRQGHAIAIAFHPELSDDARLHAYFLELVGSSAR